MSEAKLKLSVDGVRGVVGGLGQVQDKLGAVQNRVSDFAKSAAGLTAVGGALSAGAFAALVKSSIDAADRLSDLSAATGITVENLAGLGWVAQLTGTNLEDVSKAVNKLAVEMGENAEGFARLGITAKDPLEALMQLSDVFVSIEDPQQRAAVANAALGQSYERLAPLLAEGSDSLRTMLEEGKVLSGVTTEMSTKAGLFNDQLDEMRALSGQLGVSIASDLLDPMSDLVGAFLDTYRESNKLTQNTALIEWVDNLALGIARLADVAIVIPRLVRAIGGSFEAVAADAALLETVARKANPVTALYDLLNGNSGDLGDALEKRNKIVERANKEYVDLWEMPANALEQAVLRRMEERADPALTVELIQKSLANRNTGRAIVDTGGILGDDKQKANDAARKAMLKLSDDLVAAGSKQIGSIQDQLRAQREQNEEIGLTTEQLADLTASRIESEAAADRELAANMRAAAMYAGPLHDAYVQYAADLENAAVAKDALADEKRIGAARQVFVEAEKKAAEDALQVWENFTENVQGNLGDGLYDMMRGNFDNIGDAFLSMLQRMMADAMAADIMNAILPGSGGSGGTASLLGALGKGVLGLFGGGVGADGLLTGSSAYELSANAAMANYPSLDGGGYTGSGARSGGIDGKGGFPAILHPQETVIDHSRGQSLGESKNINVTFAPVINIDARADRDGIMRDVQKVVQQGQVKMVDDLHRAGAIR